MTTHAVVWISHREARILDINPGNYDEVTVATPQHVHRPEGESGAKQHPADPAQFFRDVSRALNGFDQVLVVGPSKAKLALVKYAHKYDHPLETTIIGVETVDHPSDGELTAYAKHYFKIPLGRMA